ncbi:MAG: diaminopimelate epimerase [Bacteroidales bacterium]|nr:diaminopimelate epimerase [Bacteroidales bacterium]
MILRFYKYHGTGNDFILIDNRDDHFEPGKEIIAQLCHRRFGIGADGLIMLNNARGFDFGMRYFNSDGQESTMCGNGGRCVVAFADYLSLAPKKSRFLAADGEHSGSIISQDGDIYMVQLSMNDVNGYKNLGEDFIINTGSPHLVRFILNVDKIDVLKEGKALRYLADFQPEGINVNFVEDEGGRIFVRTYERGVENETLSCGTGVTASSLAYAAVKGMDKGIIPVRTKGGKLKLSFKRKDRVFTEINLEGLAVKVFEGTIFIG